MALSKSAAERCLVAANGAVVLVGLIALFPFLPFSFAMLLFLDDALATWLFAIAPFAALMALHLSLRAGHTATSLGTLALPPLMSAYPLVRLMTAHWS